MRKPRIVVITVSVCLATLVLGSWWKKDAVAPHLINLLAGEVIIQQISGLELSFWEASIEKIQIKQDRNSDLVLDKVKISNPFYLIFNRGKTRKTALFIDKLTHVTRKEVDSDTQDTLPNDPIDDNIFSLSQAIQDIILYIPDNISVKTIELNEDIFFGPLEISRNEKTIRIKSPYKSAEYGTFYFSLLAKLSTKKVNFNLEFGSSLHTSSSEAVLTLLKGENSQWNLDAHLISNLKLIAPILGVVQGLTVTPSDIIETNGQLSINTSALVPDNLSFKQDYKNIFFQLESNALEVSIPTKVLNSKFKARLSTHSPIAVRLRSLSPLLLESATGSGSIEISSEDGIAGENLLVNMTFDAIKQGAPPIIQAEGSLFPTAFEPVLQSTLGRRYTAPLHLTQPKGELKFKAEASLNPIGAPSTEQDWLNKISLTLLPGSNLQFDIKIPELPKKSPLYSTGLNRSQFRMEIKNKIQLTGEPASSYPLAVKITEGAFDSQLKSRDYAVSMYSQLRNIRCHIDKNAECMFEVNTKIPTIVDPSTGSTFNNLDSSAKVHIQSSSNTQELVLEQVNVVYEELKDKDFIINKGDVQIPKVNCTFSVNNTNCAINQWNIHFEKFTSEYFTLSGGINFSKFYFKETEGNTELSSNYSASKLKVETPEDYSFETSLTGSLFLSGDKIQGQSQLQANALTVNSRWHHDVKLATGAIQFSLPKASFNSEIPLSQTVQGLPVDLVSGALTAEGTLSWPQHQNDTVNLILSNIAAIHGGSFATGIEGKIQLENDGRHWFTQEPYPLTIQSIDAGLPLSNIHFSLSLNKEQDLLLENFTAEFLDGKLNSETLSWNLTNKERSSILHAQNVSLEKLANETESENFKASGRLNLTIPISTGPDGVTVKNGSLEAIEPGGRLRYYDAFSPQMLASNPQLKMIASALEDYDFRTLEGNLQYPPSGDLQLSLKLVGHSESMDSERDLVINLNLENNIPAMLRSLQASRDLTEALQKRLDQ
ncbi:YdbH domain-containing protein [uncultured Microbulbifer sp.]|uniref:intermembrane phospholipid transport protein YdbH family protein n=1 Tax=uncultured Microbulbifer sp. TaxID=348147 RepID=UPI00263965BA|nr:YdbH domain-containing protein [uncultured Microbulbifer sp.]